MSASIALFQIHREARALAIDRDVDLAVQFARRSLLARKRYVRSLGRLADRHRPLAPTSILAFDPNQPRVPAGNPDGGQWTVGGGVSLSVDPDLGGHERVEVAADGHHYVPRELYNKEPLQPETRRVFARAKTGPLLSERHQNSGPHMEYNKAVIAEFRSFLSARGIEPAQMTPDQARTFVQHILSSRDPRIFDFNYQIWRRELRLRLRLFRGPRSD
ncbi:hypothetical protein [Phreatobacter cathodiphilus]|uniref:Uncharacterized protein n=1 Tax=Phreatobacter cathodiphilus TaxID=1868589 RepID=A0A2S0NGR0_9HYPH|nr:hypothetical protein [Phreatobacter cathodiphilus]AVO47359.1 hypothetical protein C6569_21225 [Phreatobacter cathodiphilus]